MEIRAQIDSNHAEKLNYIQQHTQQDLAEVLGRAIDLYYQQLQTPSKNALQAFQEAGLVGCIGIDPTESYQTAIQDYLEQKYQQGQA